MRQELPVNVKWLSARHKLILEGIGHQYVKIRIHNYDKTGDWGHANTMGNV